MHINNRTETSSSLRAAPQSQPGPAPSEQHTDDQKEVDKQKLPRYEVKDSHASLQRFRSVHGKAGKASVDDDTSANAGTEADKPSASAAGDSVVRRRKGSRTRKKDSAGQAAESSAARGRDAVPNRNCPLTPVSFLLGLSMLTGWLFREPITGLLFNGGTQAKVPLPNSDSPITQAKAPLPNSGSPNYERVGERLLQHARHAVLEQFGSYIPADAHCYKADAEISDDIPNSMMAAHIHGNGINKIRLSPRLLSAPADLSLHIAMHEYCHCFTHPEFKQALKASPNSHILEESLTEQILYSGKMSKNNVLMAQLKAVTGRQQAQGEAQELEEVVGEVTLMRAYFSGDTDAISEISRAAVDIYPKKVTRAAWFVIDGFPEKEDKRKIAECFVGASLLAEGTLPPLDDGSCFAGQYLPVKCFSDIVNPRQQNAILQQAKQARDRLGEKFDQAFYNFDLNAAYLAMVDVSDDLLDNWKPVMTGKSFDERKRRT